MRIGQNPDKLARTHHDWIKHDQKLPENVLAATVVYIPRMTDYYEEALDILKISIGSLVDTIDTKFDLMVFDNGSCAEVIDYLIDLRNRDVIQFLWLSSQNAKKKGAWHHIFTGAQSEYIYFFDCDILHKKGWFQKSKEILDHFPNAGMVNSYPTAYASKKFPLYIQNSIKIAESNQDIAVEYGHYSSKEWLIELYRSLDKIYDGRCLNQIRITYQGKSAFIQTGHEQFLCKRDFVQSICSKMNLWSMKENEIQFDIIAGQLDYMKLGCERPYVIHLGNSLHPMYEKYLKIYTGKKINKNKSPKKFIKYFMQIRLVRNFILLIHLLTFNLLYKN